MKSTQTQIVLGFTFRQIWCRQIIIYTQISNDPKWLAFYYKRIQRLLYKYTSSTKLYYLNFHIKKKSRI